MCPISYILCEQPLTTTGIVGCETASKYNQKMILVHQDILVKIWKGDSENNVPNFVLTTLK